MTAASLHVNNRRKEADGRDRMRRPAALVALAGTLVFVAQIALAQAPTRLTKLSLMPQPGDQLEVRLVLDGPPRSRSLHDRQSGAHCAGLAGHPQSALTHVVSTSRQAVVDTINAVEASGRTRVVFNLDRMQPYTTRTDGNAIVVTLGNKAGAAARRGQHRSQGGMRLPRLLDD
jgi:type IV pilus assembly protein PilQ